MSANNKKSPVVSLNIFLRTLVVLAILAIASGFYLAYTQLKELSTSIDQTSSQTITDTTAIQNLKSKMVTYQSSLDKAANFTVSGDIYANKITSDISSYASKTGLIITGYDTNPSTNSAMNSSIVSGVSSRFITVTVKNPVSYTSLVQFLSYIESSLPKIQVTGIKISPVSLGSSEVNVDPITIEVFIQ